MYLKSAYVGKLEGQDRYAEIGIVIDTESIVHRIKTGQYDVFYPDYELFIKLRLMSKKTLFCFLLHLTHFLAGGSKCLAFWTKFRLGI